MHKSFASDIKILAGSRSRILNFIEQMLILNTMRNTKANVNHENFSLPLYYNKSANKTVNNEKRNQIQLAI